MSAKEQARQKWITDTGKLSAYELAKLAGTSDPDMDTSPGANFLGDVADDVVTWVKDNDLDTVTYDQQWQEQASTIAAEAAYTVESRGTHRKWLAWTDLGLWWHDTETPDEMQRQRDAERDRPYGLHRDSVDPLQLSDIADAMLQAAAERLALSLLQEAAKAIDDAEDDAEDDDAE